VGVFLQKRRGAKGLYVRPPAAAEGLSKGCREAVKLAGSQTNISLNLFARQWRRGQVPWPGISTPIVEEKKAPPGATGGGLFWTYSWRNDRLGLRAGWRYFAGGPSREPRVGLPMNWRDVKQGLAPPIRSREDGTPGSFG